MKPPTSFRASLPALTAGAVMLVSGGKAHACAACFGQSDSPLAVGLNWGIMSLLVVVVSVLGGVVAFFVHTIRRAETPPEETAPSQSQTNSAPS